MRTGMMIASTAHHAKCVASLENELEELLGLCREWGLCLQGDEYEKIVTSHQLEDREFALRVLQAEGFRDPENETEWVRRLSDRFKEHFGRSAIRAADFMG